ncbi:MAG: thymidine phosphorylase [bacterium]
MDLRPLIEKKRRGKALARDELEAFVAAVVAGSTPDYQISALLMAIVLLGLDFRETVDLTRAMARHGETLPRRGKRPRIGKHSTGGVGDKTSFLLGPLVASYGVEVPLMAGRGLGHTGGTIDKLAGIPGFKTELSSARVGKILHGHGFCIFAQSERLSPADRRLYALRDASGTVESLPLIVASILSKKLIEGLDGLVMDVKYGAGSLAGPPHRARALARLLLRVGKQLGLKVCAVLTAMDQPLGQTVGNNLEILECLEVLRGQGPRDLVELTVALAREMLAMALGRGRVPSEPALRERLGSGELLAPFLDWVKAQGGSWQDLSSLGLAPRLFAYRAPKTGYVQEAHARELGLAAMELGAGRRHLEDRIDPGVGICLLKKIGDRVGRGEALADLFYRDPARLRLAQPRLAAAFRIGPSRPAQRSLVKAILKNYRS